MQKLLEEIRACTGCEKNLPLGPRPIVSASASSKIAIIGQAPGTAVHKSGVPWGDPSGRRLRKWMGINDDVFYDETNIAIIPMGFCYPGKGRTGDLPPRPECAPLWHKSLFESITDLKLTLLIGQYAQQYYLKDRMKRTLTDTVKNYSEYLPEFLPLPHPSPRNNIWLKKNEWFERDLVPKLKKIIDSSL